MACEVFKVHLHADFTESACVILSRTAILAARIMRLLTLPAATNSQPAMPPLSGLRALVFDDYS
jgi:hypothetical protein